jgi:hypothetical protein
LIESFEEHRREQLEMNRAGDGAAAETELGGDGVVVNAAVHLARLVHRLAKPTTDHSVGDRDVSDPLSHAPPPS